MFETYLAPYVDYVGGGRLQLGNGRLALRGISGKFNQIFGAAAVKLEGMGDVVGTFALGTHQIGNVEGYSGQAARLSYYFQLLIGQGPGRVA